MPTICEKWVAREEAERMINYQEGDEMEVKQEQEESPFIAYYRKKELSPFGLRNHFFVLSLDGSYDVSWLGVGAWARNEMICDRGDQEVQPMPKVQIPEAETPKITREEKPKPREESVYGRRPLMTEEKRTFRGKLFGF